MGFSRRTRPAYPRAAPDDRWRCRFREMMKEMAWNLVMPSESGKAGLLY
jgi:hypothetical protein